MEEEASWTSALSRTQLLNEELEEEPEMTAGRAEWL